MRVLIVEDEPAVASFLGQALRESGYVSESAATGRDGLPRLVSRDVDLAIVDVMLPDADGFDLVAEARRRGARLPILMLTARATDTDIVSGLDAGADDYLTKPFELDVLLARVRALLRRRDSDRSPLSVETLIMDPATRKVERGGRRIDLSAREYALLEYLMRNRGRVVSKAQILDKVWDDPYFRESNIVEVYVNYLRGKIEFPERPRLLHTVRGVGYVLESREEGPHASAPLEP
ncbi:MAG: response regulator transcription factor [Fimbriimonadaceae bacterium]|nr:response regulator transcription factor [Fimbriimonadaceae bacterium]